LASPPDPDIATTPTTPATPSNGSKTTTTTVYSLTTTISSGSTKPGKLSRATQRLATCITRAQGDVNKIVVCQRKFVP
jgi:hypothetical protein